MPPLLKSHSKNFPAGRFSGRGFTLIELLVSIAIFASLSSFLIVRYRDNEKIRTLKNQAQEAIAGLEKVQNMALTGATVDSLAPSLYRFSIADCSENCGYELTAVFSDGSELPISPTAQTQLKSVRVSADPASELAVEFSSPRGKMALLPGNLDSAAFEISNDQAAYCVKLNAVAGRIDLASGACP